ncbi:Monodehydroascorbate reductase 4, peroxisomal [Linum perenne]
MQALKLEEFGVSGSDAQNVCYLRDIADANRLVDVVGSRSGGNAVVIGGGYIGMECAASLVINKMNVTLVFPEAHCSMFSVVSRANYFPHLTVKYCIKRTYIFVIFRSYFNLTFLSGKVIFTQDSWLL